MVAGENFLQHLGIGAEIVHRIGQVDLGTNRPHLETATQIALAQARIDQRRFPTRIGADQQAGVCLLDPCDRGVEQVSGAVARLKPGPVLAAVDVRRSERGHEVLERHHRLAIDHVADDARDLGCRRGLSGDRQ